MRAFWREVVADGFSENAIGRIEFAVIVIGTFTQCLDAASNAQWDLSAPIAIDVF